MAPSSAFWPGRIAPLGKGPGPERAPEPRAVVVLDQGGGHAVTLGGVDSSIRCDLGLVEDLLRLQLHAKRLGWTIRITEVQPRLRELFDLVGLTERLGE